MDLDRGTLARIDRRMLSELSHTESSQMLRVPVSEAMWSTWRRYCAALGISMGRAVAGLIDHELGTFAASDASSGLSLRWICRNSSPQGLRPSTSGNGGSTTRSGR